MNDDVRLLLAQAWAQSLSRSRAEAAATIARIEPLVGADTGPLPDGFSSAAASLATLQGIFSWGDFDLGYTQALRATELEGPGSAWRPVVCWAMGLNLLFRGEFAQADRWFVEATELAPARGQWLVACAGLAYRSLIAGQSGRLELQARLAEQATAVERERGLEDVAAGPSLALGASLAARGRAADALPVLEHAVALARFGGQPGVLTRALSSYASVLCELGDHEQARAALAEARSIVGAGWASRSDRLCPDCATSGEAELTQRERTILSLLGQRSQRVRHRPRAVRVAQHRPQPHQVHLPQARCVHPVRSPRPRPRARHHVRAAARQGGGSDWQRCRSMGRTSGAFRYPSVSGKLVGDDALHKER